MEEPKGSDFCAWISVALPGKWTFSGPVASISAGLEGTAFENRSYKFSGFERLCVCVIWVLEQLVKFVFPDGYKCGL